MGCDYKPAFASKGKIRPLKVLENNSDFQKAFSELGVNEDLQLSVGKVKTSTPLGGYNFNQQSDGHF